MDSRTVHLLAPVGLGLLGLVLGRVLCGGIARISRCPISPRLAWLGGGLTCGLFLACLWRFGWQDALVPGLVLVSLLVPLALIDAVHWRLPFALTLPGIAAGVLLSIPEGAQRVEGALWGVAWGFLGFRALEYLGWRAFGREALGGGDKYLLALLGAFLTPWPLLAVVTLAALQAALFGLAQRVWTRRPGGE